MAVITLTAVFPPVLVFNVALIPHLRNLSIVLRTLALCVAVTIVVTWVMMPRLMRLFRGWLHPTAARRGGVHRGASAYSARGDEEPGPDPAPTPVGSCTPDSPVGPQPRQVIEPRGPARPRRPAGQR